MLSWPSCQTLELNRYYHVTCLENTLWLRSLLESKHIVMGERTIPNNTLGPVTTTTRFHPIIEDWFSSNACTSDIEEYPRWGKSYADWEREHPYRILERQWGCQDRRYSYEPVLEIPPEAPIIFQQNVLHFCCEKTSLLS